MKTFLILALVSNFAFASLKNSPRKRVVNDFTIATKAIELNCDESMTQIDVPNEFLAFTCSNDLLIKIVPVPLTNDYFVFLMENSSKPDLIDLDSGNAVFQFNESKAHKLIAVASSQYFKSREFKAKNPGKQQEVVQMIPSEDAVKKKNLTKKWLKQ